MPADQRRRLYVQIIESLSPDDIFNGQTEGRVLTEALALAGVAARYNLAVNLRKFVDALTQFVCERAVDPAALPVLHLSMHGSSNGVRLTDGLNLSWAELRELIYPASEGKALLCMSSCFGFSACRMAMDATDLPFLGVVGHFGKVSWSAAAVAYVAFYHRLAKGDRIDDATTAMQHASGESDFFAISGKHAQQLFQQHLDAHRAQYLRELMWNAFDELRRRHASEPQQQTG